MGLPGLSGFISEAMCFIGAFPVYRLYTILAISGIIITAAYMLWTLQRVFFGTTNPKYEGITDINARELWTLIPLAAIVVFLGIYPHPILNMVNNSMAFLGTVVSKAAGI
jgi:NADH-quinone oxidoreductase subunit M